jgi:uncharacterized membrane protein YgcG
MRQKWILILFLIPSLLFSIAAVQNGKDYSARSYITDVMVEPGGDLLITETVTFEFSGGPFTFVYRDIPTAYTNGINIIGASMDGRVISEGAGAGQYEIQPGSTIRVTWHFDETFDQVRTYSLQYRVLGAVRQQPNADTLEWNLLPTEYEYQIQSLEALVQYPDNITLRQPPEIKRGQAQVESAPGEVVWNAANYGPNEPLQVMLQFPPGSLITAAPAWQIRDQEASAVFSQVLPIGLLAGFVTMVLGILLFTSWKKRAVQADLDVPNVRDLPKRMSPPADLPPAHAGLIVKKSGQPDWATALGTLIDLSRRGWVQMVELKSGVFKTRTFEIHLLQEPGDQHQLRPHEYALLEMLFEKHGRWQSHISANDLSKAVSGGLKVYSKTLQEEMEAEGWISAQRRTLRSRMYAAALILFLLGIFIGTGLLIFAGFASNAGNWAALQLAVVLGAVFVGLGLAGLAGFIIALNLSPLSEKVLHQAVQWESFSLYLKDVTRNREPVVRPDLFEVYLPYAASFGLAQAWAKYFQKQGLQQTPVWFTPAVAGQDMSGFIYVMGATSSSGSSDAGGAGGGGAGGGGGSGAGISPNYTARIE